MKRDSGRDRISHSEPGAAGSSPDPGSCAIDERLHGYHSFFDRRPEPVEERKDWVKETLWSINTLLCEDEPASIPDMSCSICIQLHGHPGSLIHTHRVTNEKRLTNSGGDDP